MTGFCVGSEGVGVVDGGMGDGDAWISDCTGGSFVEDDSSLVVVDPGSM